MYRLIKSKSKGFVLTNICGLHTEYGIPMVGSTHCRLFCPHFKGTIKVLLWEFVKCKR
jgi:hypothetical protein